MIVSSCEKDEIEDNSFPECECFIETSIDSYSYPIRPGSEEWKAFTSGEQMFEATQVPNLIWNCTTYLKICQRLVFMKHVPKIHSD